VLQVRVTLSVVVLASQFAGLVDGCLQSLWILVVDEGEVWNHYVSVVAVGILPPVVPPLVQADVGPNGLNVLQHLGLRTVFSRREHVDDEVLHVVLVAMGQTLHLRVLGRATVVHGHRQQLHPPYYGLALRNLAECVKLQGCIVEFACKRHRLDYAYFGLIIVFPRVNYWIIPPVFILWFYWNLIYDWFINFIFLFLIYILTS